MRNPSERKKKSTQQSELRTVRAITNKLPRTSERKPKRSSMPCSQNWKAYLSKDAAFRQSRSELAAALIDARKLLEEAGKKRLFHRFLEAKKIPKSTAYDFINDYERASAAPEALKEAAEEQGVDLTTRRPQTTFICAITSGRPG